MTCMQSYELLNYCHAFHCVASFVHLFAWDCQPFALHIMMLKLHLELHKLLHVQGKGMYSEQSPMYAPGS